MKKRGVRRALTVMLTAAMLFSEAPAVYAFDGDAAEEEYSEDFSMEEEETEGFDEDFEESEEEDLQEAYEAEYAEEALEEEWEEPAAPDDADTGESNESEDAAGDGEAAASIKNAELLITVPVIMYGEDGSNENGNLDALFNPVLKLKEDGSELSLPEDLNGYSLCYGFFAPGTEITAENFFDIPSLELSEQHAGTELTAAVLLSSGNDSSEDLIAVCDITIVKRKISVSFNGYDSFTIDEKEAEDGRYCVSGNILADGSFIFNSEENDGSRFAADIPDAVDTEEDVFFIMPEGGIEEDGEALLPMEVVWEADFLDDFEVVGNIFGDVSTKKARYYLFFSAENNGRRETINVEIPRDTVNIGIASLLADAGMSSKVSNMNGLIDGRDCVLGGWLIDPDGYAGSGAYTVGTDFAETEYYDEYDPYEYTVSWGTDYHITAILIKHAGDRLYISVIPQVFYCGKNHVSSTDSASKAKQNDLMISVFSSESEYAGETVYDRKELIAGKDYSIKYKNNKNASMKLDEITGAFVAAYTNDEQRPSAIIIGKGKYAGFTATAYFEIIPIGLGTQADSYGYDYSGYGDTAVISGLKNSYSIKNGKLSPKASVSISKEIWDYSYGDYPKYKYSEYKTTLKLKEGTDYIPSLYKWNDAGGYWVLQDQLAGDINNITEAGDYVYVIRGCGNYCGSVYGQWSYDCFDDGIESGTPTPAHFSYNGTTQNYTSQFRVTNGDSYWDLANAKLVIGRKSVKWDGNYHTKDDFKMDVTIGTGSQKRKLREGVDYKLTLTSSKYAYLGKDQTTGKVYVYNDGQYISSTESEYSYAKVKTANTYSIKIEAIAGSDFFGSLTPKTKIKIQGIDLKPSYFDVSNESYNFTGKNVNIKWSITKNGLNEGLKMYTGGYLSSGNYPKGAIGCYSAANKTAPGKYTATLYAVGDNVDHSTQYSKDVVSVKDATMQKLIDLGYINFSFSSNNYNVKGSYPDIVINYRTATRNTNGTYSYSMSTRTVTDMNYNNYEVSLGALAVGSDSYVCSYIYPTLVFNCTKNKVAGGTAYVKVKLKGKGLKGSATKGKDGMRFSYVINPIELDNLTIPTLDSSVYMEVNGKKSSYVPSYYGYGTLFAVVGEDAAGGKASIESPTITLYQTYFKNKNDRYFGRLSVAPLKNNQFTAVGIKKSENESRVRISAGGNPLITGFKFGDNIYTSSLYHMYDEKAEIAAVKVRYKGQELTFSAADIPTLVFEGGQIRFDRNADDGIINVTLKNGTELKAANAELLYGDNIAAGKKKGSVTVKLKYNSETRRLARRRHHMPRIRLILPDCYIVPIANQS